MLIYTQRHKNNWVNPYVFSDNPPEQLSKICQIISRIKEFFNPRIQYIKIESHDVWNMDTTLANIIYQMLLKLKEVKQGSPHVKQEDVPVTMRFADVHKKWEYILDEMIWAFKEIKEDYPNQPMLGTPEYDRYTKEIDNGLRLFAVYYQGLWD